MKIRIDKILKDFDDKPIIKSPEVKDSEGKVIEKEVLFSVKEACMTALVNWQPSEKVAGDEKFRRFELAVKVKAAKTEIDVSVEEIALVKQLIGDLFSPIVVGQAWNALEGKDA